MSSKDIAGGGVEVEVEAIEPRSVCAILSSNDIGGEAILPDVIVLDCLAFLMLADAAMMAAILSSLLRSVEAVVRVLRERAWVFEKLGLLPGD